MIVKLFSYDSESNASAALHGYGLIKSFRGGPSTVNTIKRVICKFIKTVSLHVALLRARRATKPVTVEKVTFATAEVSTNSSNATVGSQSVA